MSKPLPESVARFREWIDGENRRWSDELWPRAFWFDVFISHRRLDWSRAFAEALVDRGLVVYHTSALVREALASGVAPDPFAMSDAQMADHEESR